MMRGAALAAAAGLVAGCASASGAGSAARGRGLAAAALPGGGDAHVEVACVLVPDGAVCSFTAAGRPGERCVRVLYGATSGTVVASGDVCSGPLADGESSTRALRFPTRPGEVCGASLAACESRAVAPGAAIEIASSWQAELHRTYSGPLSEADCKGLTEHKYEIYARADCERSTDPVQRDACVRNVKEERDRELPFLVKECLEQYKRPRFLCEMRAKDQNELYACENP